MLLLCLVCFSRTKDIYENLEGTRYNVPVQSNYWSFDFSSYNSDTSPDAVVTNHRNTPVVSLAYFGILQPEIFREMPNVHSLRQLAF